MEEEGEDESIPPIPQSQHPLHNWSILKSAHSIATATVQKDIFRGLYVKRVTDPLCIKTYPLLPEASRLPTDGEDG